MGEDWRARVLYEIEPTPAEDQAVQEDARALENAVEAFLEEKGWTGEARVEGSLAKGTYLAGDADMDCFVAFPPDVDRAELERRARAMGGILPDAVVAYAEHPYAEGTWRGQDTEIVPCYDLDDASQLKSAVDRTRFHTNYVNERLDDGTRRETRLSKAFLRGVEVYGAEESVLGFSGYLAELLVLGLGGFEDVLAWAREGFPHPLEPGPEAQRRFEEDPLVVVDPVDPTRNAAAAVARSSLVRLREAAAAFWADPGPRFFGDPPQPRLEPEEAHDRCQARGTRPLAVEIPTPDEELADPVHAQLRRALTLAVEEIERKQVPVAASALHVETDDEGRPETGWLLVEAEEQPLQEPLLHEGPPVHVGDHADSFRESWEDEPRAAGPVFEEDGHLFVRIEREAVSLMTIVEPHLRGAKAGKVVDRAIEDDAVLALEGPQAVARAPEEPLGRLLDRRPPWERASQ
ncbi:CCA tRNA nucleotidyltransferase [Thermoplasmatales archaeon SW_10_69_26]|nr:MAG: CCA tRNA nucleotidyltransferase [Thermoplasmatales archaeon SW_10_69_26]